MKKITKKLSLSRELVRPLQRVVGGLGIAPTNYLGCASFYGCVSGDCANDTAGSACDNRQCTAH